MLQENILSAVLSIVDEHGVINEVETRKYIRFLLQKGVRGFYINGSTGEAFMLSLEEKKRALEIIKEEINDDCFLMAQIGTISTKESIMLAKHAESVGVDAISAIMPFYFKFSWEEIYEHYIQIIESVDIDFCPYYIPHLSGVSLTSEKLASILKHPQVKYLKYSSNDFYILQKLKKEMPDVHIFNGVDEMLLAGISTGADGAIGSTYNFVSKQANKIINAVREGNIIEARVYQDYINTFVDMLLDVGLWQGMKYLLSKADIDAGVPIKPFLPITEKNKKRIDSYVKDHPEILE